MAEYFALTADPLPQNLFGEDSGYSIRRLSPEERIAIEDYYFSLGERLTINPATTAVVVSDEHLSKTTLGEFATLAEFALGISTIAGFSAITVIAALTSNKCSNAVQRPAPNSNAPQFPTKLKKNAASKWLRLVFVAKGKSRDGLHVTTDRYVRFCKAGYTPDGLLDLCICLESLIESETEIAFRFANCLAKITGDADAENISGMLSDLYSFRSKVVHGLDFGKAHKKLAPHFSELRLTARTILTKYILHLTEHSKDDWKRLLKSSLFT
jgi:Apea-like HEPN